MNKTEHSEALWYFAYGSNMSLDQIKDRGVEYTARIKGTLDGHKLVFNKKASNNQSYGFANVMAQKGSKVKGVLYHTNQESIDRLDVKEGHPRHYKRVFLPIDCEEHGKLEAIVYVAQPEHIGENLLVAPDYLDKLIQGQDLWGEVLVCQVRIAVEGNAVSIFELDSLEDDKEIPVLVDDCKAWLGFVDFGRRIMIRFEDPHPEGKEDGIFMTKYFMMNSDGCIEWGHHGGCFKVQHR